MKRQTLPVTLVSFALIFFLIFGSPQFIATAAPDQEVSRIVPASVNQSAIDGFNPDANGPIRTFAVQSDGMILVGGSFSSLGGGTRNTIGRLYPDGTLDNSFDPGANLVIYTLVLQIDGKILVGGEFNTLDGDSVNYLGRLNSDGSRDTSFNTVVSGAVHAIAIQSDGKIVVAGMSSQDIAVVRYNPDGSLDTTFNGTGKVTTAIGLAEDRGEAVAIQTDGKIVVAGSTDIGGLERDIAVVRISGAGALDLDFGTGGKVVTSIDEWSDGGTAIAIQADGKILVAGYANNSYPNSDFAVVRYWPGLMW